MTAGGNMQVTVIV